jgi:hypothetical protein
MGENHFHAIITIISARVSKSGRIQLTNSAIYGRLFVATKSSRSNGEFRSQNRPNVNGWLSRP